MFGRSIIVSLAAVLAVVGPATAREPEAPKIISWSNSKTGDQKTAFQVEPGEKITFSIKADGAAKYLWEVDNAAQKSPGDASFKWTVPNKKGLWRILVKTTNRAAEKQAEEDRKTLKGWIEKMVTKGEKKKKFVRNMTDLRVYPEKGRKEWTVATFLKKVNPGESIQDAIHLLPPEGGIVELARGVHDVKKTIVINRSDVVIFGTHESEIRAHDSTKKVFAIPHEDQKFDEPWNTMPVLKNLTFKGFKVTSAYRIEWRPREARGTALVGAWKVRNLTVEGILDESHLAALVSVNTTGQGTTARSRDIYVRNNTVHDSTIYLSAHTENIHVINNTSTIKRGAHAHGIWIDRNNSRIHVIGNRVNGAQICLTVDVGGPYDICNNVVRGNGDGYGIYLESAVRDAMIRNNVATNALPGVIIKYQSPMRNITFRNNRILGCRDGFLTVDLRGASVESSIDVVNNVIRNSIPGRRNARGDGVRMTSKFVNLNLRNNIIIGSKRHGINRTGGKITISHNDVWNNTEGNYNGCAAGPGDLSVAPLFVDSSKGDFHLKSKAGRWDPKTKKWVKDESHSPCIDAGDPKADCSREPAPNGGRVNIGAYGNTEEASKSVKGKKIEVKQKALSMDIKKGQLSIGTLSVHEPPNNLTNQIGQPVQFPNGDILIAWEYGAKSEYSNRGKIAGSMSRDGGKTWGKVFILQDTPKLRDSQPRFLVIDNKVHFFFTTARGDRAIYLKTSVDNGATWSKPKIIWRNLVGEQPVLTGKGDIILPVYSSRKPRILDAYCLISRDKGKTWIKGGPMGMGECCEPAVVELSDGRLYCLMRHDPGGRFQYESYSADGGMTWTKAAPSKVKSPEAPARLLKLKSGHILLVWNNVSSKSHMPRHPLVAAISTDDCKSWKYTKTIRDIGDTPRTKAIKGRQDFSNFGMCQIASGMVIVAMQHYYYTKIGGRRRGVADLDLAVFDEEWLRK